MVKTKKKGYRKKQLEEAYHLSIGRILYYLYWTQHKDWKEVALKLDVPQGTVEKWAKESGIESRSYAHEIMFPTKTVAEIEREYGMPLDKALFYSMLKVAVRTRPPERPKEVRKLPSKKQPKQEKQSVIKHTIHWTPEEVETLKRMWAQGLRITKIAKTLGRSYSAIARKKHLLKLPGGGIIPRVKIEPGKIAPTQGIVKCHNCLEEIKLSKRGFDKKYQGVLKHDEWLFWHLPGQCTGDPNAHANLLHEDRPCLDSPGRFWVTKGEKERKRECQRLITYT